MVSEVPPSDNEIFPGGRVQVSFWIDAPEGVDPTIWAETISDMIIEKLEECGEVDLARVLRSHP